MESKKILQTRATKASQTSRIEEDPVVNSAPKTNPTPTIKDIVPPTRTMRTEPIRFSEMEETAGLRQRLVRVGLFAAVIIVIGVGAILAIENANQTDTNSTSSQSSTSQATQVTGYNISRTVQTDDQAGIIARNSEFGTAQVALGSASNLQEGVVISNVSYEVFSSVSRLTWKLNGLIAGFSPVSINYDANTKVATVIFTGVNVDSPEMLTSVAPTIGSVESITASSTADGVQFTVQFIEAVKYAATVSSADGELQLDIKTNSQLSVSSTSSSASSASTTSATSSSTTSVASSSSTSSAVAGQNLDNTFSQNAQTISSGLSNQVFMRNYFYQDFGPHFEFSWTFQGTGNQSVPSKAEAKYITEGNSTYIEVKIEGVAEDLFQARSWSSANFGSANLQYANIVGVLFKGWNSSTKVSTYWVEVKGQANFRLHATSVRNDQQKLTLEIKD